MRIFFASYRKFQKNLCITVSISVPTFQILIPNKEASFLSYCIFYFIFFLHIHTHIKCETFDLPPIEQFSRKLCTPRAVNVCVKVDSRVVFKLTVILSSRALFQILWKLRRQHHWLMIFVSHWKNFVEYQIIVSLSRLKKRKLSVVSQPFFEKSRGEHIICNSSLTVNIFISTRARAASGPCTRANR